MGRLLEDGPRPVFAATASNGAEPAVEFLDSLCEDDRHRMLRQLRKLASGQRLSSERFRQLRGKIYEVKEYQRRLLCFTTPDGYQMANGFIKKTNGPTPEREIAKAELILRQYEESSERRPGEQSRKNKNRKRPKRRGRKRR